jgi:alkane 1-monooxygenase
MSDVAAAAADATEARPWRDRKRYLWILGLAVPLLPFSAYTWANRTGSELLFFNGLIWILVIVPLLDAVFGTDRTNPPESAVARLEEDRWYRWLTYLYLPLQMAGFWWAANLFVNGGLTWVGRTGLAVTVGAVAGIGIANAHELGHKKEKVERWLSKLVLAQTGYGHFYVEHNRGHHANVATPEDPASARLGESFWEFLPRTVVGSVRSAWRLERNRLANRGSGPWTLRNDVLNAWAMTVVLFGAVVAVFGPAVIPYLVIQAVFGFSLLEVVNYVEHYGLARQRQANGRYERCRPEHSWNSNHVASNVLLYHLERHSDHHAHPTRRYQSLRHFDEAPQLPSGYGLMIGVAYFPPLWRWMMDRRVVELYDGDVTRANIHPRTRGRILARWGTAPAT